MQYDHVVHTYALSDSEEVAPLVGQISAVAKGHLLLHVATCPRDTLLVEAFTQRLSKRHPAAKIVVFRTEHEEETAIILYTYDASPATKDGPDAEDRLLFLTQHKYKACEDELQESRQQLVQRYFVDSLTSLPNLYKLRNDLQENPDHAFVVINIDNFKLINDFYGFVVGDFILEQLAGTIKKLADGMPVYRMSADEYALLIDRSMDFYTLKSYLADLSERMRNLHYSYHQTIIYIDITMSSSASSSHEDMFSKVGMALKYAKEMQLPFWIYEDRMHFEHEYENNLKIALKVRKAIEESAIVPYFQPIISNTSDRIEKFECLARLIDSEGNILSPDVFIDIAKKIKLYDQITMTIIEKSFAIFKESHYDFSINLSIEDIMSEEIYTFIVSRLKESGLGPRVIFELLESEAVEDYKKVSRFITEVKRFGARVAIDDFGSGFSNFSYLTKIDVDLIKIDGSLIADIDNDDNALLITETIVDFARKMKIKTIAEFVHSSTVLSQVKKLGIDFSQGYYIDRPLPNLPIDDVLKAHE